MDADPRHSNGQHRGSTVLAPGDEELVAQVRSGDRAAFDVLYERHRAMARHVAAGQTDNRADVEDVVSDAFASVLESLTGGKGPDSFFRAYLLTAVRRIAHKANRAGSRTRPTDESYILDSVDYHQDPILAEFESTAVAQAFRSLPERWQAVLWCVDIEGMKPRAASTMLGLSPNGVSSLALRARESFRQAYLQNHVTTSVGKDCQEYSSQLGAYARKGLSPRTTRKVQAHLEECSQCMALLLDLDDVQSAMRSVLFPLITGIAFTSAVPALASSAADAAGAATKAGAAHGGMALPLKVGVGVLMAVGLVSAAVAAMGAAGLFAQETPSAQTAPTGQTTIPTPTASSAPEEAGQLDPPATEPESRPTLPSIQVVLRPNPNPSLPVLPQLPGTSIPKEPPSLPPVLPTTAPSAPETPPPPEPTPTASASESATPGATPTVSPTPSPSPTTQTPTPTPTRSEPEVTATFTSEPGTTASDVNLTIVFNLGEETSPASAEVTFTVSEGAGIIPGKIIEPAGWSCKMDDDVTAQLECTSTAADPGDLVFRVGITRDDPTTPTTMTYIFSGSGITSTTFANTF